MFEDPFLSFVNDSLYLGNAHVVYVGDLFEREAPDKTIAKDAPMPFVVDPFINRLLDLTITVLDHRARTRPDPPQVPQVLY